MIDEFVDSWEEIKRDRNHLLKSAAGEFGTMPWRDDFEIRCRALEMRARVLAAKESVYNESGIRRVPIGAVDARLGVEV